MNLATTKSIGPRQNRAVLAMMGLLAATAACSEKTKASAPSSASDSAPQFALTVSGLPACGSSRDGQVYFVSSNSMFYVCRSSGSTWAWVQTNLNGFNGVSLVTPVSPGSQCPAGGSSIQFGLDQNRNNTLDTTEVSSTTLVCNGSTGPQGPQGVAGPQGATGATGQNGLSSLIATTPELAGANCAAGGVVVKSGLDLNRDGTLQPAEVQNTSYVCNGTSGGCGAGSHDNGSGTCVPTECSTGYHNGGDGSCVPTGTCSESYHNDGIGGCLQEGCALGFHDGGGLCVPEGICETGWHDNGAGMCVHVGCTLGFHDNGAGTCVQTGCSSGYHNGGDRTCVAQGTCVEGYHNDGTGACVQAGCALGFHDGGGTCVANGDGAAGTAQGDSCSATSQCVAGLSCTDGVCCTAASCGTCMACNLNGAGTCSLKPINAADSACPASPANCMAGGCDGLGSCKALPVGASCGSAVCTNGAEGVGQWKAPAATAYTCNGSAGAGSCQVKAGCNGNLVCASGTACKTSCSMDADCVDGYHCSGGTCLARKANGTSCSADLECQSRVCVSSVCRECESWIIGGAYSNRSDDCPHDKPLCISNVCHSCRDDQVWYSDASCYDTPQAPDPTKDGSVSVDSSCGNRGFPAINARGDHVCSGCNSTVDCPVGQVCANAGGVGACRNRGGQPCVSNDCVSGSCGAAGLCPLESAGSPCDLSQARPISSGCQGTCAGGACLEVSSQLVSTYVDCCQ